MASLKYSAPFYTQPPPFVQSVAGYVNVFHAINRSVSANITIFPNNLIPRTRGYLHIVIVPDSAGILTLVKQVGSSRITYALNNNMPLRENVENEIVTPIDCDSYNLVYSVNAIFKRIELKESRLPLASPTTAPSLLDVPISTRATEATLNAVRQALTDNTIVGLFRSIGDAGASPFNTTGKTVLAFLNEIGLLVFHTSTTTPLAANATYVSAVESYLSTYKIVGTVFADASGTLIIEQSQDNTNWDYQTTFSVTANTGLAFNVEKVAQYTRARYVNGTTAQTVFRLYIYRRLKIG